MYQVIAPTARSLYSVLIHPFWHGTLSGRLDIGQFLKILRSKIFFSGDWLWRSWSEEWVVLYEDSTLAWFKDKGTQSPRGRIRLSEAPDLLAVGEWTRHVPRRPRVPSDCHVAQLLAFANRQHNKIHWLMAQSPQEVR